jgi:predicted DNA binding CopG/RHH family protein
MEKKLKKIPKFKNEDEEREFWETHSSMDYVDWSKAKYGIFFDVKPSTKTISIRFSNIILAKLKQKANYLDVPYQALIKQYVEMGLRESPIKKYHI